MSLAAVTSLALVVLAACTTVVPPSRTLPEHIKRIYIREFKNSSRLFGAQADLTLAVNDEFMLDGRLDVVQNERADVRLEGRVKSFKEYGSGTSGDRWPLVSTMEMVCLIELWDPYDNDRVMPIARYTVPAAVQYVSDPRRSIMETQTDARERLMSQMAKNIVQTVISGTPESPRPLERKAVQRYQERSHPAQQEPVISEPRFPVPTPPVN